MNDNQEMQFADPAWEPEQTQGNAQDESMQPLPAAQPLASSPVSPKPGNQTYSTDSHTGYEQGYRARTTADSPAGTSSSGPQPFTQPYSYQNQQQQPPWYTRLPPWAWALILLAVFGGIGKPVFSAGNIFGAFWSLLLTAFLIFAGWLLFTRRVRVNLQGEKQPPETRTFEVGTLPTIKITNRAGTVRLRAGEERQVSITTSRRGYLFSQQWQLEQDAPLSYAYDRASNVVSARVEKWRPFGKNSIDFEVVVPLHSNLELATNAGKIVVRDVQGQMKLSADAGSIEVSQATLQGKSRLKTDAGSITFDGAIDPHGNYELSTDMGTVSATLPANASFLLDAKTDLGSIETNLPVTQEKRSKATGKVGNGPYPLLKLRADVGSIKIYRH